MNTEPVPPTGRATPPGLLLATLVFWGWQSDWLWTGVAMGVILEAARFIPLRWELVQADFQRIWNFCFLLALALGIYVFSTNDPGGGSAGALQASARKVSVSGLDTSMTLLRQLPVIWFLFVAAQFFSAGQAIPLAAISWIARRRQQQGTGMEPEKHINVAYPYFMLCLYSAGIHTNDGTHLYFYGLCGLLTWALWPLRARKAAIWVWCVLLATALTLGYYGVHGIGQLEQFANNYNSQLLARLLQPQTSAEVSRTAIGKIGRLKLSNRILIRLEPLNGSPVPAYLREASYRKYYSQIWQTAGKSDEFQTVVNDVGQENDWSLLPGSTNLPTVQIANYLTGWSKESSSAQGLLPLPSGTARLTDLPAFELKKNPLGAVLAAGPGLVIYQAHFGNAATMDEAPDTNVDLLVASNEVSAVDQVITELNVPTATDREKMLAIQKFFASKFTYTLDIKNEMTAYTNSTPLGNFLLHQRSGYCEYFATATVLLLREMHIPARYAVGYLVHERAGQRYVVRERDAHAWCLVWNSATKMWEDFDTTPAGMDNPAPSFTRPFQDAWSWVRFQFAKFWWSQGQFRKYALWLLIPVLGLSLYQILFRRKRKGRSPATASAKLVPVDWPGLDSEFYRLETRLAARGVPRLPGESLTHWLERVLVDPALTDMRQPMRELLRLHYQHRFDPQGLSPADRERLTREVNACLAKLN